MFTDEVVARFGVLPNFFCTAQAAPGLIEELWGFAKSAYLDSPLPSNFKERLFVYLSRFCEVRYCIVRHVGFLVGNGRPAGDASVRPHTVEEALELLRRPCRMQPGSKVCSQDSSASQPPPKFQILRLTGSRSFRCPDDDVHRTATCRTRARRAIIHAFGGGNFELLTAFLAFVRTAHYWTETHPDLSYEADMVELMAQHGELAQLMLDPSEAGRARSAEALRRALADLSRADAALRASEERFRALVNATSNAVFTMSADWSEMRALDGRGFIADTVSPRHDWLKSTLILKTSQASWRRSGRDRLQGVFELEHRVRRLDGTLGWTLSRAVPILDEHGEITEWFGAASDVNARKHAEGALRQSDRRKDEFLATLAHELRNPLVPLRNGLRIARQTSSPDNAPVSARG